MPPVAQSLRPSVPIPPVSRTSGLPPVSQIAPQPPLVLEAPEVTEPEPPPVAAEPLPQAAPPAGNAEDLQRLAALAMAQLGDDGTTESGSVATEVADLNTEAPVAEAVRTQVIQQPVAEAPVAEAPALEEPAVDQSVTEGPTTENLITQEPVPEAKVFRPLDFSKTVSMPPPVPTMTLAPTTTTGSLAKPEAPAPAAAPVVPEPEPEAPEPVKAPPMPEAAPVAAAPAVAEIPAANAEPEAVQEPAMAEAAEEDGSATGSIAFNLNSCTVEELRQIPGCFPELAESIVRYREKIGSFRSLEDLLDVPGMTKAAYTNLTGEIPPENRIPLSLNELLGFPPEQATSLKDVTDRIACWPDVTGCLLSQSSGLSLVGTAPQGLSKEAIVAFVPRMFEAINKSFSEIMGRETDDLVIPTSGTSFHIFRNKDLYLVILSRLPQMPERHMKVARFVLAALSVRRDY
jgi:competence ComEA-like helix-hairpin-helix protein